MRTNEFKCDACGGIFQKAWSEQEAVDESKKLHARLDLDYETEEKMRVCDDCFRTMGLNTILEDNKGN